MVNRKLYSVDMKFEYINLSESRSDGGPIVRRFHKVLKVLATDAVNALERSKALLPQLANDAYMSVQPDRFQGKNILISAITYRSIELIEEDVHE